jgi:hypothetical protein
MGDLRRDIRPPGDFGDKCCLPFATSCSVGQSPFDGAFHSKLSSHHIVNAQPDPMRVAEIGLREIPLQVGLADVLIDPIEAALQDREVAFDGIGVHIAAHVFGLSVIDGLMASCEGKIEHIATVPLELEYPPLL